jgi:L-fucose isomerase-like protein
VACTIADTCIGGVVEAAACAEKFERAGVGVRLPVTPCWCCGTTENDCLNGFAMLCGHLLTDNASIFADVRTYWSPDALKRVAVHVLGGVAPSGVLHLITFVAFYALRWSRSSKSESLGQTSITGGH